MYSHRIRVKYTMPQVPYNAPPSLFVSNTKNFVSQTLFNDIKSPEDFVNYPWALLCKTTSEKSTKIRTTRRIGHHYKIIVTCKSVYGRREKVKATMRVDTRATKDSGYAIQFKFTFN